MYPPFGFVTNSRQSMLYTSGPPLLTVRAVFPHTAIRYHSPQAFTGKPPLKLYNPFSFRVA